MCSSCVRVNQLQRCEGTQRCPSRCTKQIDWLKAPSLGLESRLKPLCRHNLSFHHAPAVLEMDVLPETSSGSVMPAAQQQLFFREASDASYRARGNLTPEQQVRRLIPRRAEPLATYVE